MGLLTVPFFVHSVAIDERPLVDERPTDYVLRMAQQKAHASQCEMQGAENPKSCWVLGADTTVVADAHIMGKPQTEGEATAMLQRLSGRTHEVLTAVCLLAPDGQGEPELVRTAVTFRPLSARDIAAYWASGEPADKAGGYGIQGLGARFVTRIEGNYHAVMGLPLDVTAQLLTAAGFDLWSGSVG